MTTLFELSKQQFERVKPLFDAPFDQPCYDAVFEGKQGARIFVDDANTPKAALMCRSYEYYLAGVVDNSLRQFVRDAPQEAEVFASFYGYVPLNEGWKAALLADLPLEIIGRRNFQWQAGTPLLDWRARLPKNGQVVPIDRALAERLDQDIYPVPFVLYEWGSYEAYVRYGFGFALLIEGEIASTIMTTSVSERHALITIATEPPFQRQGWATVVGACFIEACLERGLLPVWDCDDVNLGSGATARKLGFREEMPFVELALPERAKPNQGRGMWAREARADGVTAWVRRSQA